MKLTTTKDPTLRYTKILVYGDSGVGKTTSLKTLPQQGTLIAVGERGLAPLADCEPEYQVRTLESWSDVRELCLDFLNREAIEDNDRRAGVQACKMLVIDSLCEVSELCMREILQVDRRRLIDERTKGKRDTPENVYEDQMQLEDWGLYGTRMFRLLSTLSHLPVHMICTCRVRCSYDKQGNEKQRMPNLGGRQLPKDCPAYFGEVFHMEAATDDNDNPTRVWRTSYNNTSFAKDETGKLDPFEETNWTKLLTKILGDKKK